VIDAFSRSIKLLPVIGFLLVAGCASLPKPLTGLEPGKEVETLQSSVSIAIKTAATSRGGRGYLLFKRPDRFHLAVLSPFGAPLLEVFSDGERFTCLVPAKKTAYSGPIAALPDREGLKAWAMMRWVVERTPVAGPALSRENVNRSGRRETLQYDEQGLLQRKVTEEGDQAVYRDYRNVNGVAFPAEIELSDLAGNVVKINFDEPEVNKPLDDAALTPDLAGMKVLPFAEFTGF
jgi:YD repeat-containing protein